MVILDTSALIRFFTNDIPTKANQVRKIFGSKEKTFIPDVVFPELEYVLLSKSYNVTRKKIAIAFEFLVMQKNIITSSAVKKAVDLYRKTRLDMADCIIVASASDNQLFSFDRQLLSIKGINKFKP